MPNPIVVKWGQAGFGAPGGTVTWRLTPAAVSGVNSAFQETLGPDLTANPAQGSDHDIAAVLREAVTDWPAAVNINFVQVIDNKAKTGEAPGAGIRFAFGFLDGPDDILAAAAGSPARRGDAEAGDILVNTADWAGDPANRIELPQQTPKVKMGKAVDELIITGTATQNRNLGGGGAGDEIIEGASDPMTRANPKPSLSGPLSIRRPRSDYV